jgi:hypothetical protein
MEFKVKIDGATLFAFFLQLSMMVSFFLYIKKESRLLAKQLGRMNQEIITLRQEICLLRQTDPSAGLIYLKENAPQGDGLFQFLCNHPYISCFTALCSVYGAYYLVQGAIGNVLSSPLGYMLPYSIRDGRSWLENNLFPPTDSIKSLLNGAPLPENLPVEQAFVISPPPPFSRRVSSPSFTNVEIERLDSYSDCSSSESCPEDLLDPAACFAMESLLDLATKTLT